MILALALAVISVPVHVSTFTDPALFSPPVANNRSPELSIDFRLTTPFDNFQVALGARLPATTLHIGEHAIQIGLDGCVWSELGRASPGIYFPVFTADYLAAVPIMYRWRGLSAEFVLSHISAHRVDGLPIEAVPRGEFKYSREFMHLRVSFEHSVGGFFLRVYAGGGGIGRSAPWDIKSPWFFGGGFEGAAPSIGGVIRPMLAVDVTWNGDTGTVDSGIEAGFWLFPRATSIAQVRATVGLYSGSDRRGIMLDAKAERVSFGIRIRFGDTPRL
ncbi:MAG: DUF1207 domain-containing protein [Deltaproteobacteria bacterium]|nr:DUF1207 domain-containing protein [Deltaproteobacteria bacterium]